MLDSDFSILNDVDEAIFVLAPDDHNLPVYHFFNTAACRLLDRSLVQVQGRPSYDVYDGRAAYSVYRQQCVAWAMKKPRVYENALPIRGGTIWVRTKLLPVFDVSGRMTQMVGTSQNVTEQRHQSQAHALATAAIQEMEDMICLAAHDLRSPIYNLKSLATMMRKDFVDHGDGKAELIDMIDAISDKALNVVSDTMGKAMSITGTTSSQRFDVGDVCDEIMVLLDPARRHSVSYPRYQIEAERTVVHIMLRNLVDNALKHSGGRGVRVRIELDEMNAERLCFTVKDTGPGFSDSAYLRLNQMHRVEPHKPFGLGAVHRLLLSRGGLMTVVQPIKGQGAEVRLELPGRICDATHNAETQLRTA